MYASSYDHANFVEECERAGYRAIQRGLPPAFVSTKLSVHIERKVPEIKGRFNNLRGLDCDKPLEETLEILRQSDPYINQLTTTKFLSTKQGFNEQEKELWQGSPKRMPQVGRPSSQAGLTLPPKLASERLKLGSVSIRMPQVGLRTPKVGLRMP